MLTVRLFVKYKAPAFDEAAKCSVLQRRNLVQSNDRIDFVGTS